MISNRKISISENLRDLEFLLKALILAKENPDKITNKAVGAIIVKDEKIIGRGHRETIILSKEPYEDITYHAEDKALREAGDKATDGTIYVTLEPCTKRMRIPKINKIVPKPCCELIVNAGIKRVVIGHPDENFGGGGVDYLLKKGLEVATCKGIDKKIFKELINNPKTYNPQVEKLVKRFYKNLKK